jgi:hypothetical protein
MERDSVGIVPESRLDRLTSAVASLRPSTVAITLGIAIGTFAVLGTLQRVFSDGSLEPWNLDAEGSLPSLFSAALLYGAAALATLAVIRGRLERWVLSVAALWFFLGVDDANGVHEKLQSTTGVDWQILYAPLAAAGIVLFIALLKTVTIVPGRLLIVGAFAWTSSQVLELVEHGRTRPVDLYNWYMVPEEVLEMVGSVCFLIAMLLVLRAPVREPSPQSPPSDMLPFELDGPGGPSAER